MIPDHETLVERSHAVSRIAVQMELPDSGWPGEGARADVERVRAARRISWARWMVEVGEIHDGQGVTP
jgi:hypothetical protein